MASGIYYQMELQESSLMTPQKSFLNPLGSDSTILKEELLTSKKLFKLTN